MPTDDQIDQALAILEAARALEPDDPRYLRLERGVAHLVKSAKKKRRLVRKQTKRSEDLHRLRATGLAESRYGPASPPPQDSLHRQRGCYVCRQPYRTPHHYYHTMCGACGDDCLAQRDVPLDLTGRRALVTGGRVKIGYASALRLLRAGAQVHVTTRFAVDAAHRYALEPDFNDWRSRLHIHGLDFRALPVLLDAIERWRVGPPFDILINNAAQTVWHPPEHFRALWRGEMNLAALPDVQVHPIAADTHPVLLDVPAPIIDVSRQNSWTQRLADVAPAEMVEVQVVNLMAPFLICSRLRPNLEASEFKDRYIINVTALEGQFERANKPDRHPHTNMAKAGLNMLTRTSAQDYVQTGIHMVSVDPGWMSNEGPPAQQMRAEAQGFHPPLEAVDCAARIVDPIVRGLNGTPLQGVLLKDFREVPW